MIITPDLQEKLGVSKYSPEEQKRILDQAGQTLRDRVIADLLDAMSESDREHLLDLMENGTREEVETYVSDRMDRYQSAVHSAVEDVLNTIQSGQVAAE